MANPNPSYRFPKGKGRIGGNKKGSKHAKTVERETVQQYKQAATGTGAPAKHLGKDLLSTLANVLMGYVVKYQPRPGNEAEANEGKFMEFAQMTADIAFKAAQFESPRLRVLTVVEPPMPAPMPADGGVARMTYQDTYRLMKDSAAIVDVPALPSRKARA